MLRKHFAKLFETLLEHPQIEVLESNLQPCGDTRAKKTYQITSNNNLYAIDESSQKLLNAPEFLSIQWKHKRIDASEQLGGFCLEKAFQKVQIKNNKSLIYKEHMASNLVKQLEKAYYFDCPPNHNWSISRVLLFEDSDVLYFFDDFQLLPLELTITSYLEQLLLTKGSYYWQYLFCAPKYYKAIPAYKKRYLRKIIKTLTSLFPEENLKTLEEKALFL